MKKLRVMAVSHMFPNRVNPNFGIFVKERLKYVAQLAELSIIAPVPSFPFMENTTKYRGLKTLEEIDKVDGLIIYHPRYFMIPKYFKYLDSFFYSKSMEHFIASKIQDTDCSLIDFHWVYPDGIAGLDWARKYNKKIIVTVRGNEAIHYYQKTIVRKIIIDKMKKFDHVITVSNDLKNKIVNEFEVEPLKVTVISNGIDNNKFFITNKEVAKTKCGLDMNTKYILTVSRLSSEKGLEYLLKAMARLIHEPVQLIIIGEGPLREMLTTLSIELKIENKISFIGEVSHDELNDWYNAADLFCLPSLWEGCPNVVIESLACGTPVVATNIGGIPDLVINDKYGLLVPSKNPEALSVAFHRALWNDWNRLEISEFGSKNSWNNVAERVVDVYRKVLS